MIRRTAALLFAPAMLLATSAAAQEIPAEMLVLDHARCMVDCLDNNNKATCDILCDCTIDRFRNELDFDAYLKIRREMVSGELSPTTAIFFETIGLACSAEFDQKTGLEMPPTE